MWCWHKWGTFSELKKETWTSYPLIYGMSLASMSRKYTRQFQERKCLKCGKIQKRYLND